MVEACRVLLLKKREESCLIGHIPGDLGQCLMLDADGTANQSAFIIYLDFGYLMRSVSTLLK